MDVKILRETDAGNGVHHADAHGRLVVYGQHHIMNQLRHGYAGGNMVGDRKERLLIHFSAVRMIAPKSLAFVLNLPEKHGVDNAGVTVVLHHEERLVRAYPVQLLPGNEAPLFNRIGRSAESNQCFRVGTLIEIGSHFQNLCVGLCLHHIQTRIEKRKGCKVLVCVAKRGD